MKREARLPTWLPPGLRRFRGLRDAERRMQALARAARRLPPALPPRPVVDAGWMSGVLRAALERVESEALRAARERVGGAGAA